MRQRRRAARTAFMLTLVCAAVLAVPALGATLTNRNSVKLEFLSVKEFDVAGTGCGASGTGSVTLAAPPRGVSKAFAFKVVKPKVGTRDGFVRVTAVQVSDQTITVTAVAEAAGCSAEDSSEPPAARAWSARFEPDVSFTRRVQARLRASEKKAPKLGPPKSIRLVTGDTLKGIRWKGFGSKTATATARYRLNIRACTPKTCLGHRGRVKLRFSKVKRCAPYGLYEYSSMKLSFRGRGLLEDPSLC